MSQRGGAGSGGSTNRLPAWRTELQGQLAAEQSFFSDSKAEELAFWQDKLALTEAGSKEQLAVETNIYQLEKQLAVQNERDTLASLAADEKVTDAAYARKKAAIEEEAELGKISSAEEIAQLKDALDTEWALEQDYYEKKLAAAQNDAQTQEKLTEQEELAYQKYLTDKDKLDAQAVQNSQKQWESLLQPIQRALDTSITGIIVGTTTVQKALSNLAQSIIAEFVNSAVGSVFNSLRKTARRKHCRRSGGSSGDQDFSGGITGAGEDIVGGGLSEGLFGSGGLSGRSGLGSLFSGGGLFGSLFKGIGSLFSFEHGGIVPSARAGWMVPSTSLAMLHANEMVLPARHQPGVARDDRRRRRGAKRQCHLRRLGDGQPVGRNLLQEQRRHARRRAQPSDAQRLGVADGELMASRCRLSCAGRACLERHQGADVPDAYSARRFRS